MFFTPSWRSLKFVDNLFAAQLFIIQQKLGLRKNRVDCGARSSIVQMSIDRRSLSCMRCDVALAIPIDGLSTPQSWSMLNWKRPVDQKFCFFSQEPWLCADRSGFSVGMKTQGALIKIDELKKQFRKIKFSSLSAPTKIEELTAGSDEKTQRSPAGNRTQQQDLGFDSRRGCAVFFRLIRLSVLLSLSVLKEKRIW